MGTQQPTQLGNPVDIMIKGMQITFTQVKELTPQEFRDLESLTQTWFDGFYNTNSSTDFGVRRRLRNNGSIRQDNGFTRRNLQGSTNVRNMESTMTIQSQKTDTVAVTNTITYDQALKYVSIGEKAQGPEYYATLPYRNVVSSGQYGRLLRVQLPPFANVEFPIPIPLLPNQTKPDDSNSNTDTSDDEDFWTTGVIIGVAAAGVAGLGIVLGGGYYLSQRGTPAPQPNTAKTPRPLSVGNPEPAEYMSGDNRLSGNARQSNGVQGMQETTVVSGNTSMATAVSPSPRRSAVEPSVVEPDIAVSSSVASYDGKRCVCDISCCCCCWTCFLCGVVSLLVVMC